MDFVYLDAFHFDALESFYIESKLMNEFDADFIERHPSITKLYFYNFKSRYYDKTYVAEAFACVTEIEVFNYISTEDAISFLDHMRSLQKLTIRFNLTYGDIRVSDFNEFKRLMHHRQNISLEIKKKEINERTIMKAICQKKK